MTRIFSRPARQRSTFLAAKGGQMRAALLENGKVDVREVPTPEPRAEEALVRVHSAGVCHSDLHLLKGDWPGFLKPGRAERLGHEGIGVVEALGPGAERFVSVGDRVILGLGGTGGGYWCGACEFCLGGRPRLCLQAKGIVGAFAEHIRLWARSLVVLPPEIGDDEVPLACGGLTAYAAVKKLWRFGVLPGKTIAVIGAAGGLGHYAVQVGKAFGFDVIGVDVGEERIGFVRELGADAAYDAGEAAPRIRRDHGGAYGVVVLASRLAGFELGLATLRRGGIFVSVGMPAVSEGTFGISPLDLLTRDTLIMSSSVGTVEEMRELVDLAVAGRVTTHVGRTGRLEDLPAVLDELDAGAYAGRAVLAI
jgi:propanol-preferring alcohol dehydrogenase